MGARRPLTLLVAASLAAASCSGAGDQLSRVAARGDVRGALRMYQAHARTHGGSDADALAAVALVILRRAAGSTDARERNAGFAAVRSLGVRTRDLLAELRREPGVVGERAAAILYDMDGRSGSPPRELDAALGSDEPERRVAGTAALEGRGDVAGLVALLDGVVPEVRRAAAQRLGRMSRFPAATAALVEHALRDPAAEVRSACVQALGNHGAAGTGALEQALSDRDSMVRMSVPSSLVAASLTRAEAALLPLLAQPPTALALEAARALAGRRNPLATDYILNALEDPRADVRAQAAVGTMALSDAHADALSPHLEDADVEVQVRVAGVLAHRPQYRARIVRALRPVSERPDPFVAVRALGVLVDAGDRDAATPLRGALRSSDVTVRRLALLAWSRLAVEDHDVSPLAPLLEDPDLSVRLMAAAEVVRIASAE
jgi:HEAT repeat protein